LEKQLNILIDEFSNKISRAQYNQYASKLRRFLIPYILNNLNDINDVEEIFKHDFSKNHIIKSTVYYMEKCENVSSYESIRTYLTSLSCFFRVVILNKYPDINTNNGIW
jgi:hypothetical protein